MDKKNYIKPCFVETDMRSYSGFMQLSIPVTKTVNPDEQQKTFGTIHAKQFGTFDDNWEDVDIDWD